MILAREILFNRCNIDKLSNLCTSEFDFTAVQFMDGGTAGMALYEHIINRTHLIVIDAVKTGQQPGALVKLEHDEVPAFFHNKVSPHQMALSDILAALHIAGEQFPEIILLGIEPATLKTGIGLSDIVSAQLETLMEMTVEHLGKIGFEAQPKNIHWPMVWPSA